MGPDPTPPAIDTSMISEPFSTYGHESYCRRRRRRRCRQPADRIFGPAGVETRPH